MPNIEKKNILLVFILFILLNLDHIIQRNVYSVFAHQNI